MSFEVRSPSLLRPVSAAFLCTVLVCGCGLVAHAQNTIYTVAGGGLINGTATGSNADLPAPSAVATDSAGNLYIADPSAHDVFKVDPSGNITVFAGIGYPTEHALFSNGQPATKSGLNYPTGVAVAKSGIIYIADTVNYLVRSVNTNGLITAAAGDTKLCHDPTIACGDGLAATAAQLNYPIGVATDGAGNLYIADTGDNRIRVVNTGTGTITVAGVTIPKGVIKTVVGTGDACQTSASGSCGDTGAALAAQLNNPQGVAVDAAGNIYISDSGDRRIRIVSTSGVINAYAGSGQVCFPATGCGNPGPTPAASVNLTNPWQIALDAAGNLFIADAPTNSIWEMNASTQTMSVVAGFGLPAFAGDGGPAVNARLNSPRGVTVDASGNVFTADSGNERIRQFTVGGNIGTYAGGGSGNDGSVATSAILGGGRGVALDSTGNLYIADTYNNRIRMVTPGNPPTSYGNISTIAGTGIAGFAGDGPASSAPLNFPTAIAVDSSNNVYFTDSGNFVIREYTPGTGNLAVVAGTAQRSCNLSGCGDGGPAKGAYFAKPQSIALDSAGNIYVADAGTHSIRVVNMGSAPITIAGVNIQPGNIQTVAGSINGTACTSPLSGQCGDTGPATSALLNSPFGVAVDSAGNIFIADTGDNRVREVVASTGNIVAYAYKGTPGFGPSNGPALNASYNTPHFLAIDPRGNLYVSGSDFDYVVERINIVNHNVIPVAAVAINPKFFGWTGDGGLATAASIDNAGVVVDGSGHLFIADDANNRVREVLMTPAATPTVASLTFPPQTVGTTSATQSFLLKNGGSDDLFISGNSVTGPFRLRSTSCASNIIAAGAQCSFNITFRPTVVGPVSGSITINDNAFGSPSQTVTLNGTGQ